MEEQLPTHLGTAGRPTAICSCEAGQSAKAVDLYRRWLTEGSFSRRDYGYFLSLLATTLATAREPQDAARTGLQALTIAQETSSTRTISELRRMSAQLTTWANLPDVKDLHDALTAA